MTTSRITYNGQLRTTATHLRSGTSIITDAPVDNRGKGEAFSPTDLVATALASCMLTIMGIRAMDNQIDMKGANAEVTKVMASDPRRIAGVEIRIVMPQKGYTDEEKSMLEEAARGCPVCRSLSASTSTSVEFVW